MMYSNEKQSFFSYDVIGEIPLNILEHREGSDGTISIKGKLEDIFYEDAVNAAPGGIPKIVPNRHAFNIRLVSVQANRIVRSFTALVTDVISYTITDDEPAECSVSFRYIKMPTEDIDPRSFKVIEPVISHILTFGDFIALLIEGDRKAVTKMVRENLKSFRHGDVIYHGINITQYDMVLDDGQTIESIHHNVLNVVIGATTKVPSSENLDEFKRALRIYIKSIYGMDCM